MSEAPDGLHDGPDEVLLPPAPDDAEPVGQPRAIGDAASDAAPGSGDPVYTIDELAAAADLPVRTVRHYQSEKVLQPPERRGRIALYRPEHLERLQLIGRLQDRGLRLSAIRDAFKRIERGELWLDDWLGLGDELGAPWSEERPVVLTEEELADRVDHRAGLVSVLERAGLIRRQQGLASSFLVPSPGLLDISLQLHAAGIDIETASDAAAMIRKSLRQASADLVEHFLKRAGAGFARRGSTQDITEALQALRPLGARAVQLVFVQEIERALRHTVQEGRARPAPPSLAIVDDQIVDAQAVDAQVDDAASADSHLADPDDTTPAASADPDDTTPAASADQPAPGTS